VKSERSASNFRLREDLRRNGYCIVPDFLDERRLASLQHIAAKARRKPVAAPRDRDAYTGHVTELGDMPDLASLLCWARPFALLRELGFTDPRWFMAFLMQKPPGGLGLYWHQDWWGWSDPISYQDAPPLLFLMVYLVDVTPANGCLRALPGTHISACDLHVSAPQDSYVDMGDGPGDGLFSLQQGEVDVPVRKGDLIVRDARMLHATHPNHSPRWRPMIMISVAPNFRSLPEPMRRTMEIKRPKLERRWPNESWDMVHDKMSVGPSAGDALPIIRVPDFRLANHLS